MSRQLDRWVRKIAKVALVLMLITLVLQIVARYLFASPPTWTEEIGKLFMVWCGLLGASAAFRSRKDVVIIQTPENRGRVTVVFRVVRFLGVLLFAGTVLYYSPSFLVRSAGTDFFGIEGVPVVYASAAIPVYLGIVLVHAFAQLISPFGGNGNPANSERSS